VAVEGYESRHVNIRFEEKYWWDPIVTVDGPEESPHRYAMDDGRRTALCLWRPGDPSHRVWQPEDGLIHLFGIIAIHLLKEAWWREHGPPWLGDEHSHGALSRSA